MFVRTKKQRIKYMGKNLVTAVCIVSLSVWILTGCLSNEPAVVIEPRINAEELEAFGVTVYTEKELFPLERLVTLDGAPYNGGALRGKYALVNLWATWCPYCKAEKPSMQRLYDERAGEGFTILAVSVGEDANTVRDYMSENKLNLPVALDPKNEVKEIYAPRIPTSYVLDPEGIIIARINGNKEWDSEQAQKVLEYLVTRGRRSVSAERPTPGGLQPR